MTRLHYRVTRTSRGDYAVERYVHAAGYSRGTVLTVRTYIDDARRRMAQYAVADALAMADRQATAGLN